MRIVCLTLRRFAITAVIGRTGIPHNLKPRMIKQSLSNKNYRLTAAPVRRFWVRYGTLC
jgi:hypothetical protein